MAQRAAKMERSLKYRSEIDGLRAVAVVPVVLFHAGVYGFSGGFVGVDVFFVISGYLITTLLIGEFENGIFSIVRFYERRARRILPALFTVILFCLPFAWFHMVPVQLREFSRALVAVGLFASNILFWLKTDYFAPSVEENPLIHTWSLAVEEQFYIIFPVLLIVLWKFGKKPVFLTIVTISIFSLALSEWGSRYAPSANFYLLPTRAWELGVGVICAFVLNKKAAYSSAILSLIGLLLITSSIYWFDSETPFPSSYAILPVGGTALVIIFARKSNLTGKLLSFPIFVGIGLLSYSTYLWHQPLFAFARISHETGSPSVFWLLCLGLLSIVLAYLTWRFVEQPFRNKSKPWFQSQRSMLSLSGASIAVLIGMGLFGHFTNGFYNSWASRNPLGKEVVDLLDEARQWNGVLQDDTKCRFNSSEVDVEFLVRLEECSDKFGPGLLVLGDSHSGNLFDGMFAHFDQIDFLVGLTKGHCRPHVLEVGCQYEPLLDYLSTVKSPFSDIYYTQAGFHLLAGENGELGRGIISSIPVADRLPFEDYQILGSRVEAVIEYLNNLSSYASVTWIGPRVEPHIGIVELLAKGCEGSFHLRNGQRELYLRLDDFIKASVERSLFKYRSQIEAYTFDIEKDFLDCDTTYWTDGDHWSRSGAERFVGKLDKAGVFD